MNLTEKSEMTFLGTNLRVVGVPVLLLVILVVLTVFVVNTGFKQISEVRNKLTESQKQEVILASKLDTLQKGRENFENFSNLSIIAVPDEPPSAVVSSQLKAIAATGGIVITKISVTAQRVNDSPLQNSEIEMTFEGELVPSLSYINSFSSSLPLLMIEEVRLSGQESVTRTQVKLASFFAPLPETLPAITVAIGDLSEEEKGLLTKFAGYSQPTFSSAQIAPGGPYERTDLFNF